MNESLADMSDMRVVRCFGTEGRAVNGPAMPPSAQVFDMVVFKGMPVAATPYRGWGMNHLMCIWFFAL